MPETRKPSNQDVDQLPDHGERSRGDLLKFLDKAAEYSQIVWEARLQVLVITGILAVLFALYIYLGPGTYVATATLLPDLQGLENLQKRGAVGELAAAAGLTMGLTPSQLFPDIIRSERILGEVVNQKFNLGDGHGERTIVELWHLADSDSNAQRERVLKALRRAIDVTLDRRTLIVTLQVTTEIPDLSAQLANSLVSALDGFTLEFRKKLAGEERIWIENRLAEVRRDLTRSEEVLKNFREKNRIVTNSPQLLLEQTRLAREVEINSTIFVELKKQLEIVKVQEAKNLSIVLVLDPARPPYLKSGPARRYIVATFFVIVLLLSVAYVILAAKVRRNPDLARRLKRLRSVVHIREKNA
jgi:uncharacterized protein involved in exopolysaccharide biosynthesis